MNNKLLIQALNTPKTFFILILCNEFYLFEIISQRSRHAEVTRLPTPVVSLPNHDAARAKRVDGSGQ